MLNMSELSPLILTIAIFLGGVVSGFSGFAFSAVSGAILLHFLEPLVAIPLMMCCSIASQISSLAVIRQYVRWRESAPLLVGGAAGVPIALYFLTITNAHVFRILIGIFLVTYAIYSLTRPGFGMVRQAASPIIRTIVGFAGGLVGGLTAMPGSFKRTAKGRGSTVQSHGAGPCHDPADFSARHTSSRPSFASSIGSSRGCRRHPGRHFALGQNR